MYAPGASTHDDTLMEFDCLTRWKISGEERIALTLILLTWTKWRAPTNASKWWMGFNPYPANVDNMVSSYQC